MEGNRNLNEADLEQVAGGAFPDKQNPWVLEITFYNPTTQKVKKFSGSYPSKDAARNAEVELEVRHAGTGYELKLAKIYKAL